MKKILIPTDFSDCARAAESIGLEIASKSQAEIQFLHIIDAPVNWVDLPLEKEKLYPEIKIQIGHAKNELSTLVDRAENLGLIAGQYLSFGEGIEGIERHVQYHNIDFVVMGSHGARGFKEIIGSNTQKVVRHSHVPVLVIKKNVKIMEMKSVVFASNFEEDVQQPFSKVLEFADLTGAQVHLLFVNTPFNFKETDEIESRMSAFLEKCPEHRCTMNIFNATNEESGILKFAKKTQANLIAMTTHGRSGFMKVISSSITESLVNHSDIPVLSINTKPL